MNRKRVHIASLALAATGVVLLAGALALHDVTWPESIVNAVAPLAAIDGSPADALPGPDAVVAGIDVPLDAPLDAPLGASLDDVTPIESGPLLAAAIGPVATRPGPRSDRASVDTPADCPTLLRQQFNRLQTGEPQSLCQFRGKVLLVVNTASYCAYTGQYEGLEAMYRKYRGRGFVVVGFPSNDFGGQEPGSNQEIAKFCRLTYGVEFPMFEKSSVTSLASNPLFAQLASSTGVSPQWNFYKYVIDRHGMAVAAFDSKTTPDDPRLVRLVEALLAEKVSDG